MIERKQYECEKVEGWDQADQASVALVIFVARHRLDDSLRVEAELQSSKLGVCVRHDRNDEVE